MFDPQVYCNLYWCSLTPELSEERGRYRYLVTEGATSHVAFRRRTSFERWLLERGLVIHDIIPQEGEYGHGKIDGIYCKRSWMDRESFEALEPVRVVRVMDNAKYTVGKVTEEIIRGQKVCVVNYLNVNVPNRPTLDYNESKRLYG